MTGRFADLLIPFAESGGAVAPTEQARHILEAAREVIGAGAPGAGITYSANYGQTRTIGETYFRGGWRTGTDGANQAAVIGRSKPGWAGRMRGSKARCTSFRSPP